MREFVRFAGAVALVALVALATTPGADLSTTRLVDALVVLIAAVVSSFCAGVAEVRRVQAAEAAADDQLGLSAPRDGVAR
ncbi:hypothetical protein ACRAWC_05170 [Leifsonia sp. L25]|uniref:hypothetical protein n=1 Tax=Leifsonia sp. L25 TaxID=3423957 RepID=UPI003D69693E